MFVSIVAFLVGAVQVAPVDLQASDLPAVFAAACLDGQAKLPPGEATRVSFGDLPPDLKGELRRPSSGNVWRLAGGGQAYLYILNYPDVPGTSPQICGVASDEMNLEAGAAMVDARLSSTPMRRRARAMQWIMPKDGYTVTATTISKFDVLQVNWLSSADRKLERDQESSLPR